MTSIFRSEDIRCSIFYTTHISIPGTITSRRMVSDRTASSAFRKIAKATVVTTSRAQVHCSIQQRIGLPHLGMDSLSTSRHTTTSPSSSRPKPPWLAQTLQSPVRPPSLTNRYTRRPVDTFPAASAVRSRTRCSAVSPARCNNGSIQTNFAKRRTSRTGSMFLDSWLKCSCC